MGGFLIFDRARRTDFPNRSDLRDGDFSATTMDAEMQPCNDACFTARAFLHRTRFHRRSTSRFLNSLGPLPSNEEVVFFTKTLHTTQLV